MIHLISKVGKYEDTFTIYSEGGVKMKGDKKILALAVLVLLLSVCFGTYAIYRQSSEGTGTIKAATWSVKVKNQPITSTFTFDYNDITWTALTGYNNTIAPGSTGQITIPVDATGSEVDVILTATLGTITGLPTGMTVSLASGSDSQTINYNDASKTKNVVIEIAWAGADSDNDTKDSNDLSVQGTNLSIPVTLTAKQSLADHH